jgi:hypothetical protein
LLNGQLKALPDALNDVFAVLGSVDDPTYGLFKGLGPFGFIEALVGIISKNSFNNFQNIQKEIPSGVSTGPTNTVLNSME